VREDGTVYQQMSIIAPRPRSCWSRDMHDLRDLETSWALDVHEERVGLGHNLLELVGSGLDLGGSVK